MPKVRWRRVIDVPSRDLPTIATQLRELADRESAAGCGSVEYTADIEVFDTDSGSVVVWTATFAVPTAEPAAMRTTGVAVFRDFVEQLHRELKAAPTTLEQAS